MRGLHGVACEGLCELSEGLWNTLVIVDFGVACWPPLSITTFHPNRVVVAGATHGKSTLSAMQPLEAKPFQHWLLLPSALPNRSPAPPPWAPDQSISWRKLYFCNYMVIFTDSLWTHQTNFWLMAQEPILCFRWDGEKDKDGFASSQLDKNWAITSGCLSLALHIFKRVFSRIIRFMIAH